MMFETTELQLACYLKANKLKLKSIEKTNSDKCKFIFQDKTKVMPFVEKWFSPETDFVRTLLQCDTELKFRLKQITYQNKKYEK